MGSVFLKKEAGEDSAVGVQWGWIARANDQYRNWLNEAESTDSTNASRACSPERRPPPARGI